MFTNLDYFFVFVAVVYVLTVMWVMTWRPLDLPPGPPLIPLLGNVLSMSLDTRGVFRRWRRQYGDIFSVYAFNKPIIVLNGFEVLKDALVKHGGVFSDRPHSFLSDHLLKGRGIVGTSGPVWQEQRKFAVNTLKKFGVGKSVLERKILEEIDQFLDAMGSKNGTLLNCKPLIGSSVANIICSVVLGKRFDYDDRQFRDILKRMDENIESFGAASVLNVLPIVCFLPGDIFKYKKILRNLDFTERTFVQPIIAEHMQVSDDDKQPDFISEYITEMRHRKLGHTNMDAKNLETVVLDIFGTGSETIATTICWALVYFLNYPDVQEKCFQEIKEKIGLNRSPSMKDKTSLPYLAATIAETLRFSNITPAGVPRTVTHDIWFRGYKIPKGVMILPVLDSVLHDANIWGDPETFRPERFLDESGKYKRMQENIAFSMGERKCLGEALSNMELFLFLVAMLQRFRFVCEEGKAPSLDPVLGIILSPRPFLMRAVRRSNY